MQRQQTSTNIKIMSTLQIRETLHQYINEADDRFIQLVYGMVKEDKKGTVAHTVHGNPLTQQQYKTEIDKSRKQYEQGDYITQEELEQKAEKW